MRLHVGTCGYSYKEWKGTFYPDDIKQKEMLAYYGERFDCVEMNSTYYRLPRASTLEQWAAAVPEHFQFAFKASRRITHDQRLARADDLVGYLLRTVATLGPRLGPLLFQLPPSFRVDVERLRAFVALLPRDGRFAFEFRHPSWDAEPAVREVLAERGIAVCITDDAETATPPSELPFAAAAIGPLGYARLMRVDYGDDELAGLARALRAAPYEEAYVFFKHHQSDEGPAQARAFGRAFEAAA